VDLLIGLLPLVLYVVIDWKYGLTAGIYAAIAGVIVLGIWYYLKFGMIDELLVVEGILIVGMGLVTVRMKDSKFFKFQPVVMGTILTFYMIYCQLFAEPLFVRYAPMIGKMLPEKAELFASPSYLAFLAVLSRDLIFLLAAHTMIMVYAALKLSNIKWMLLRTAIYPALLVFMVVEMILRGNPLAP
jgi:intracellular septation protein A